MTYPPATTLRSVNVIISGFQLFSFVSDDIELDAQVSTQVPSSEGERHSQVALFDVSNLRFQGNRIYCRYCLPKRKGKYTNIV